MSGPYLGWYRLYVHFRRLLLHNGILPGAKFTLRPPSLALCYWQRYCTAVEQWARAELCGVEHRASPISYSAGRPSGWALPHIPVHLYTYCLSNALDRPSNQFFPSVSQSVSQSVCLLTDRLSNDYVNNSLPIFTKFCMRLRNVVASSLIVCERNRK